MDKQSDTSQPKVLTGILNRLVDLTTDAECVVRFTPLEVIAMLDAFVSGTSELDLANSITVMSGTSPEKGEKVRLMLQNMHSKVHRNL